jgi:hypothetical protein
MTAPALGPGGESPLLIDRNDLRHHLPWIVASLAVAVLAAVWFFAAAAGASAWPSGSSLPGFTFGVSGGLICLFEFLLWPRKKVRAWRLGRMVSWMRAHVWLGLLAVPLLVFHTGFRWGGPLSTVLMILFLVVIASGVWGLVVQQFLPRILLDNVPAETIYSQIDHIAGQLADEGWRLVAVTCGPETGTNGASTAAKEEEETIAVGHFVVGAVRSAGGVRGVVRQTRAPAAPVADAEPLRTFFRTSAEPYLRAGSTTGSPLGQTQRAAAIFEELRTRLNPAAHEAVATLESLCEQRRQLDLQARLHFWLHNWLCVHLPLSVALIVLMFVHAFVAIRYW